LEDFYNLCKIVKMTLTGLHTHVDIPPPLYSLILHPPTTHHPPQ
jgi:hypothetical protein